MLQRLQNELFVLGADLATPSDAKPTVPRITGEMVAKLESEIDEMVASLPPLRAFILPGGSELAARLHVARTVARRAERRVVRLIDRDEINLGALVYLNRLSDHLFVLARAANIIDGADEPEWHPDPQS